MAAAALLALADAAPLWVARAAQACRALRTRWQRRGLRPSAGPAGSATGPHGGGAAGYQALPGEPGDDCTVRGGAFFQHGWASSAQGARAAGPALAMHVPASPRSSAAVEPGTDFYHPALAAIRVPGRSRLSGGAEAPRGSPTYPDSMFASMRGAGLAAAEGGGAGGAESPDAPQQCAGAGAAAAEGAGARGAVGAGGASYAGAFPYRGVYGGAAVREVGSVVYLGPLPSGSSVPAQPGDTQGVAGREADAEYHPSWARSSLGRPVELRGGAGGAPGSSPWARAACAQPTDSRGGVWEAPSSMLQPSRGLVARGAHARGGGVEHAGQAEFPSFSWRRGEQHGAAWRRFAQSGT